jgi:DNA invertase Pin-like site-specific DNA recombinase
MQTPRKNDLPWFAYIRVSSKDQGDKYGPARQVEYIQNWLRVNGAQVPGLDSCIIGAREVLPSEYVGFDKQTGKNDERPDFQRGYGMAKSGKIGGFISLRLDRVARNAGDAYMLRSKLKRMGVRLEFATQAFDNTATGDLMYTVYAGFAELEGKMILERTADGRIGRLRDDHLFHSPNSIPYGYIYVDEEVAKKNPGAVIGKVIVHKEEAKIVRLIFRMYVEEEKTSYAIMMHLNRKGVKQRNGGAWWRESVTGILRKADRYAGVYVVRLGIVAAKREHQERVKLMGDNALPLDLSGVTEVQLELPALIDEETARRAKAIQAQNKVKRAGRPAGQYPLSGFVYCAVPNESGPCGGRWYFGSKTAARKGIGYCKNRNYQGGGFRKTCDSSLMVAEKLEAIVIGALKDHLRQPEVAHAAAMQAYRQEYGKDAKQLRADSEAKLAKFKEEQEYYGTIILNPAMTKLHAKANTRFAELEIAIQDLERELRRAPDSMIYWEASIVAAFGQKLKALEQIRTFEDKREFFEATLQRIDMTGEEVVISGTIAIPQKAINGGENWKRGQPGALHPHESRRPAGVPAVARDRSDRTVSPRCEQCRGQCRGQCHRGARLPGLPRRTDAPYAIRMDGRDREVPTPPPGP